MALDFSLQYDEAHAILHGQWLTPAADDEALYPVYANLLAAAKAHDNCHYWLLDMRQRPWHSANFGTWYSDFLANQVVREIGAPVFVAYIAAEKHRQAIEDAGTQAMLKQAAQVEFYPYFFSELVEAEDWLAYY